VFLKQAIVITTIYKPSKSVKAYTKMSDIDLIVVGDLRTPADWCCVGANYISVADQDTLSPKLSKALPLNHYSRKMLGYLLAKKTGADIIVDTDDDNLPKSSWGFPAFQGNFELVDGGNDFINIYQWFTSAKIWPRGLPLDLINTRFQANIKGIGVDGSVGIWQGLADGDPDVDAIYRLTSDELCVFNDREPLILKKGTICPFNSQNTAIRRELFPLLYLPAHVTFRFTDILRGLVAQPIMWLYGYSLGFTNATVIQDRNPHNYMHDFISELPMYQHCRQVVEIVSGAISTKHGLENNLYAAYEALLLKGIVVDKELHALEAWLSEISDL
jgi:hypothetical protein